MLLAAGGITGTSIEDTCDSFLSTKNQIEVLPWQLFCKAPLSQALYRSALQDDRSTLLLQHLRVLCLEQGYSNPNVKDESLLDHHVLSAMQW